MKKVHWKLQNLETKDIDIKRWNITGLKDMGSKKLVGGIVSRSSLIVGSVSVNLPTCYNLFATSKPILMILSQSFVFICRAVKNVGNLLLIVPAEVIKECSAFLSQLIL